MRFRPVHRLDEDTSGLVLIAKNPYVHQQLSDQHGDGRIEKRYLAYTYGKPLIAQAGLMRRSTVIRIRLIIGS